MNVKGKVEIFGITDTGRIRKRNEDNIGFDNSIGLAVVADGMGGHAAGDVASATAVHTILSALQEQLPKVDPKNDDPESQYNQRSILIKDAIDEANTQVFQASRDNMQFKGMGTTIVVMHFYDDQFTVAHVGDSRMYRFRDGELEQITKDHTLVQELVDRGFYSADEAREAVGKNIVTRALGIADETVADIHEDVALPGDILIACSDGLTDMVNDELIHLTLQEFGASLEATAQQLVNHANANGGRDNISVMLAKVIEPFPEPKGWFGRFLHWFD